MRQVLGPGAMGKPRGSGWRGRWEGGSGWGTHVNPWLFHFNVWQNPLQKKKLINKDLHWLFKKNKNKKINCGKKKRIYAYIQQLIYSAYIFKVSYAKYVVITNGILANNRIINKHFTKKYLQMANKYMKICFLSLFIGKMQVKP